MDTCTTPTEIFSFQLSAVSSEQDLSLPTSSVQNRAKLMATGLNTGSVRNPTLILYDSTGTVIHTFTGLPTNVPSNTELKILFTNTGSLKYTTRTVSASTGTATAWVTSTQLTPPVSTTTSRYVLKIKDYPIPGTTTPITKLEIVASGGVIKATYPSW
jgi:hypothetical protein